MDFALDATQEMLRDTTRKYLEADETLAWIRSRLESAEVADRQKWKAGADLGWASMLIPESAGGGSVSDQPVIDLVVLAEELGRFLYPAPFLSTNVLADALTRDDPSRHAAILERISVGDALGAWCLSGDGTIAESAVAVDATRAPDGGYFLDGVARYVEGASVASVLLVDAILDRGLVRFVVELPSEGVNIRTTAGLDLTRRLSEVWFRRAYVDEGSRLNADRRDRSLSLATVVQSGEAVGGADRLVTETIQYSKDRIQFGRPIGSFQAIKHRLADLYIASEAMRAATYYAALAFGDETPDADEAVAVAGAYVKDTYAWLCGECLQIHGGIGFTWEHDIHLYLRRAKTDQVLYGQPHEHREALCRMVEAEASIKGAAVNSVDSAGAGY